jgi:enoyl-CoA hydratase/carnithine racemase
MTRDAPGPDTRTYIDPDYARACEQIHPRKALEMLLLGEPISAYEAERIGLVNRVVAANELDATAEAIAVKLASTSPYNTQMGKQAFYKQTRQPELALKYATAQECVVQVWIPSVFFSRLFMHS